MDVPLVFHHRAQARVSGRAQLDTIHSGSIDPWNGEATMRLPFSVSLLVCSLPVFCVAADAGALAAALKEEASECRYLQQLCERAQKAQKDSLDHVATDTCSMPDLVKELQRTDFNKQKRKALEKEITFWNVNNKVLLDLLLENVSQLGDATNVVKAKHEKIPECYNQCSLE
jgi:hypothetical protein